VWWVGGLGRPRRGEECRMSSGGRREADAPVRLQFRLTGPGGGDWYVVVRGAEGSRHAGVVDDPDATLEAEATDWLAVQAGTLDRLQAFMGGKLRISGGLRLLMVHEELIRRLGREE